MHTAVFSRSMLGTDLSSVRLVWPSVRALCNITSVVICPCLHLRVKHFVIWKSLQMCCWTQREMPVCHVIYSKTLDLGMYKLEYVPCHLIATLILLYWLWFYFPLKIHYMAERLWIPNYSICAFKNVLFHMWRFWGATSVVVHPKGVQWCPH